MCILYSVCSVYCADCYIRSKCAALSVVTPYSAGDLSFHYPNSNQLVQEESLGLFWISSTETFSNGSQIIRLRRRRDQEQFHAQEGV